MSLGNLQFTETKGWGTMAREARRSRLVGLLMPRLLPGEQIVGTGAAWFARVRGSSRLLFVGRHYRPVALTDQRLLVFRRRRRAGEAPLMEASIDSLRLVRASGAGVLFSVLFDTGDGGRVVLEFRPRERVLGRALVHELRERAARS
jgi:hypothetical protein